MFNPPDEDWALSNAYWIAILSNNQKVFGEDNSPSDINSSKWIRLKEYLNDNKLRIKELILKFRSNELNIPIDTSTNWVYLSKAVGKEWTASDTDKFFVVGWNDTDNTIKKRWYKIPELVEHREVSEKISDQQPEFLHFMPIF